jgi:cytochrome c oxidase cbb3-type subunit III
MTPGPRRVWLTLLVSCAVAVPVLSCEREARRFRDTAQTTTQPDATPLTTLAPGGPRAEMNIDSPFHGNAYAIAEGKRLFTAFNCNGCHASAGGGSIGPALRDDKWIYGYSPSQIYSTIVQGRPDGMPSFGGRIPDQQVWQLVAYVESLSAAQPRDAAPSRTDDLQAAKAETSTERLARRQTGHR